MTTLGVFTVEVLLAAARCFVAIGAWRLIDYVRGHRDGSGGVQ
jgi:hypothetical protein